MTDIIKNRLDVEPDIPQLCDQVKAIIETDVYMKFYNGTKSLYIGTGVSGIGPGTGVLQVRNGMCNVTHIEGS